MAECESSAGASDWLQLHRKEDVAIANELIYGVMAEEGLYFFLFFCFKLKQGWTANW